MGRLSSKHNGAGMFIAVFIIAAPAKKQPAYLPHGMENSTVAHLHKGIGYSNENNSVTAIPNSVGEPHHVECKEQGTSEGILLHFTSELQTQANSITSS